MTVTAMTWPERRYYILLGSRIRQARERAGLTQLELARRVGLHSAPAVCHWEKGENRLSVYQLTILDRIFEEGWRWTI